MRYVEHRASETRGLTWGAVHLERGEIEIFARADASGKLGSPKTGNSRRSIPVGPRLIQELREFKLLLGRPKDSDGLFASKHGNVMNRANIIKDWWHPAQMQAFRSVRYVGCMRCGTYTLTLHQSHPEGLRLRKSWFRRAWATAPLWSRWTSTGTCFRVTVQVLSLLRRKQLCSSALITPAIRTQRRARTGPEPFQARPIAGLQREAQLGRYLPGARMRSPAQAPRWAELWRSK